MHLNQSAQKNAGDNSASVISSDHSITDVERERLFEWTRLIAARVNKSRSCIEQHEQRLRALGETDKRLKELDNWHQASDFTAREKAAMRLSETISWNDPAEYLLANLIAARFHLTIEETVRLALTVLAVNEWIDIHEKQTFAHSHFSGRG